MQRLGGLQLQKGLTMARYHSSKKPLHKSVAHHRYESSRLHHAAIGEMEKHEGYVGREETRRTMKHDGGMIHEDHAAPCLLPRHVIEEYWPKAGAYHMGYTDTLFQGVQEQLHEDTKDFGEEYEPRKY